MAPKTLGDVISAVPKLWSSCSIALADGNLGSGIKLMRLVSKQLRTAMLCTVQGYTLDFTESGVGLLNRFSLLQDTRLSLLRVVAPTSTGEVDLNRSVHGSHCSRLTVFVSCERVRSPPYHQQHVKPAQQIQSHSGSAISHSVAD